MEVIVAIAVLTILIAVFFPVVGWLTAKTKYLQYDNQASALVQEGIEVTYDVLQNDWDEDFERYVENADYHPVPDMGKWTLSSGDEDGVEGRFTRSVTVSKICRNTVDGKWVEGITGCSGSWVWDINSKLVKTRVIWVERGRTKTLDARFLISRI